MSDLFPSPNRIQSINQWNEMRNQRNDQSSQQSIEWIQLSKVSHLNWCLICFACYSFNSINQSSERKKERKSNKQINQQSISLSFVRFSQFNSIQFKKRKEMIETNDQEDNHKASKLSHSSNKSHQSINQSSKWKSDEMRFVKLFISNKSIFNVSLFQFRNKTKSQFNQSINKWKKEWFWFGLVSFQLGVDFHSQSNLIPISNQSIIPERWKREMNWEREREKWINNQVCFLHSSINQSINQVKWNESIFIHSFYSFEVKVISMMMMCNWSESESIRPSLILLLLIHWSHSFITQFTISNQTN